MADVEINDAVKFYGKLKAIHGIDISIQDGEFVVLVGPSGCGKSTLLRMIAGLEQTDGGSISIGGTRVNDVVAKDRDIAMVFQSYALYPHMKVRENMSFSLKMLKQSKEEIATQVAQAAEILGLEDLLDRYPRQLSGGQRQRVAMGRAIVRNPSVFLFDEPLSNLDAKLRVAMRAEIKSLHQRLGATMIYVTHDQIEAMTMADRIVVMNGGQIEQVGVPLDLYDKPENLFVAGFLGSPGMNFLKGKMTGDRFVTESGHELRLPPSTSAPALDRAVIYGVRPESFNVADDGLPLHVDVVEPTGSETQISGTLGKDRLTVTFRDRINVSAGDILNILPDHTRVHLFDPETEHRINEAIRSDN